MFYQMTIEQFLKLMEDPRFYALFVVIAIWTIIWKGIALWKASRNYQKIWFVVLLCVNTVGILEILYLFYFSKRKGKQLPMNPVQ